MSTAKLVRLYLGFSTTEGLVDYTTSLYTYLTTMTSTELGYYNTTRYVILSNSVNADVKARFNADFPFPDIANYYTLLTSEIASPDTATLNKLVDVGFRAGCPIGYEIGTLMTTNPWIYYKVAIDANFSTVIMSGRFNMLNGYPYGWIRTRQYSNNYLTNTTIPIFVYNSTNDTIKATNCKIETGRLANQGEFTIPTISLTSNDNALRPLLDLPPYRPPDPYSPGGYSGSGGGNGTFDFSSTDIPIPPLPSIGAYNTGFISLYRPSESDLQALASYLWSGPFDLDNFKKIFANPMDCILGMHIIPTAGSHPVGATSTLMVGNLNTGLSMQRLSEQYFELDCGTIIIDPKWGAYLDYSPYSKLSLYLPYIGFVTISPDDCMNGTIRVVYHVDVLSGSCCAYVYCASNQGADGHTLYTFTGGCACDCPVTEGQYTNGLFGSLKGGIGLATGLLSGTPAGIMGGIEEAAKAALSMVKPDVGRSGSFGGSAGLMGIQYPYLVLTIPKMCTPRDQDIYRGYPSFVTEQLSNISGYASVEITHMEHMSATDEEVLEIMGLLGEGVIF